RRVPRPSGQLTEPAEGPRPVPGTGYESVTPLRPPFSGSAVATPEPACRSRDEAVTRAWHRTCPAGTRRVAIVRADGRLRRRDRRQRDQLARLRGAAREGRVERLRPRAERLVR